MKIGRNEQCPCGSGKKYKRCCLPKKETLSAVSHKQNGTHSPDLHIERSDNSEQKGIMFTVTGEIYQPVRLYYKLLNKHAVQDNFKKMRCMDYDEKRDRWVWLYLAEANKISFSKPYDQIPKHAHPIVIGSFFTKADDEMYLDIRSIERAVEAVLFFDKHIDRSFAKVTHVAVLNRLPFDNPRTPRFNFDEFFESQEMKVHNPDELFADFEKFKKIEDSEERSRRALEYLSQKTKDRYPDAEKFPIHFYEDGIVPFKLSLSTSQAVAIKRLKGNKEVTYNDIIGKLS